LAIKERYLLLLVEDGQYVEAGTEVARIFSAKTAGGGSNAENDDLRELVASQENC